MRDRKRAWRKAVRDARKRVEARRRAERAAQLNMTVAEYRAALGVACALWVRRFRWLSRPVALFTWDRFGARFAGRFLAKWGAHG